MNQKATLAEMAAVYRKTPKTFRKHVVASGIPHELIGRSMLFDPLKVSAHFEAIAARAAYNVLEMRLPKSRKRSITIKSKFAEAAGIASISR